MTRQSPMLDPEHVPSHRLAAELRKMHAAAGRPVLSGIADKVGVDQSVVSRVLNGRIFPNRAIAEGIARSLDGSATNVRALWTEIATAGSVHGAEDPPAADSEELVGEDTFSDFRNRFELLNESLADARGILALVFASQPADANKAMELVNQFMAFETQQLAMKIESDRSRIELERDKIRLEIAKVIKSLFEKMYDAGQSGARPFSAEAVGRELADRMIESAPSTVTRISPAEVADDVVDAEIVDW